MYGNVLRDTRITVGAVSNGGEVVAKILTPLIVSYITNSNYVSLYAPFGFQSDVLKKHGLKDIIYGPAGFVFDFESTPNLIRGPLGENKRGGVAHDILSRKNVCPGITQSIAADVYFEIMEYCDAINTARFKESKHPYLLACTIIPYVKTRDWLRRWAKSTVVRYWPGGYWQKYELTATAKDIYGIECDPYVAKEMKKLVEETKGIATVTKSVRVEEL